MGMSDLRKPSSQNANLVANIPLRSSSADSSAIMSSLNFQTLFRSSPIVSASFIVQIPIMSISSHPCTGHTSMDHTAFIG